MAQLTAQSLKDKALRDLRGKKLPQALKKAQLGIKSFPKDPDFHGIAGFVLTEMKRYTQSIPHFAEASRMRPDNPQFAENLANALMQTGRLDRALAYAEKKREQFSQSIELERVIDEIISKGDSWLEIIAFVSKSLESEPDNAQQLAMRARAYQHIEFLAEATRDIKRAYALDPEDEEIALQMATNLSETGDVNACKAILSRIVENNPLNVRALLKLSSIVVQEDVPALLEYVEAASAVAKHSKEQLAFAKAHLIRCRDGLAASMPAYAQANAKHHKIKPYDPAEAEQRFDNICSIFPVGCAPPSSALTDAPAPIFVVGQPRSGTTLMEMMLSAVQGVVGCGEFQLGADLARPYFANVQRFGTEEALAYAHSYRRLMPPLPEGTGSFVDKMPNNYQRLGLLLSAFPNARVIDMLRDPRDVGLSAWIRLFPARAMRYANNLEAIAHSANLYRKYMKHWQQLFGERVMTVSYEALVEDPETCSRRIAQFCNLQWTEQMLHPEENAQQVRTASLHQVREKITTGAVGGWHQVRGHLEPMLDGLIPELWPEYDLTRRD